MWLCRSKSVKPYKTLLYHWVFLYFYLDYDHGLMCNVNRYLSYVMDVATPTADCLMLVYDLLMPVLMKGHSKSTLSHQEVCIKQSIISCLILLIWLGLNHLCWIFIFCASVLVGLCVHIYSLLSFNKCEKLLFFLFLFQNRILGETKDQIEQVLAQVFENYKSLDETSLSGVMEVFKPACGLAAPALEPAVKLFTLLHDILSPEAQNTLCHYFQVRNLVSLMVIV